MSDLTDEDRVALLLKTLGDDVAEQVFDRLSPNRAGTIRRRMNGLQEDTLEVEDVESVLGDFDRYLKLMLHAGVGRHDEPDDNEHPSPVTLAAPAEYDAQPEEIPQKPEVNVDQPPVTFEPSDDPVADINRLHGFQIANALESEQPLTVSLVLKQLSVEKVAAILACFPDELRSAVFLQLKKTTSSSPGLIKHVLRTTVVRGLAVTANPADEVDAEERMAQVLRSMDRKQRGTVLESIEADDAELADRIRAMLYVFEDLLRIEKRSIQKLLAEVDTATLATALSGAAPELASQITDNMSRRAAESLREEIEFGGAKTEDDVSVARLALTQAMGKLDQAGDLQMRG